MENDFVRVEIDESWIFPADDVPPVVAPPEPPREPTPPVSRRLVHVEPDAGPWFPVAISVFIAVSCLSMFTMSVNGNSGMGLSLAIAGVFGVIYLSAFLGGSYWFDYHRRR